MTKPLCPFCGAYSPRQCYLDEETEGICPWEEMDDDGQPDEMQEWSDSAFGPDDMNEGDG